MCASDSSKTHYGKVAIILHWLIGLAIITMLGCGLLMGDISDKALRHSVYNWHKCSGVVILALVLLRIIWRLLNTQPALPQGMSTLERLAARVSHGLLYVAMLVMPVSGWMMATAAGYLPKFGHTPLAMPFIPLQKALAHKAGTVHEYLAWILIGLVTIHVLAALKHHFINKDTVLKRMLCPAACEKKAPEEG